ncbi:MAG: thioesterase family protein [Neisseria sp.]|nr:thioesterase family protein [Neisseria sp.]
MERVQITLPSAFAFSTQITVQIGDINYGQHLSNDAVLRLCHEARLRFLQAHAYHEMDVEGRGLIIADAAIKFMSQAFHGDVLTFNVAVGNIGRAGFALFTQIVNASKKIEIARVKNGMVFFDYTQQTTAETPDAFREKFS